MNLEPINPVLIMRCTSCAVLLALTFAGSAARPLAAQSLAEVARQEEARRKAINQPSKVLTNKDLGSVPAAPPPTDTAPASAAAAEAGKSGDKAGTDKKDAAKKDAEPAKGQGYWSGRMKELQTALSRDQTFAEALQTRISALTTDFTNRDDPAQRAVITADRQKALDELSRLTKQIADDKNAIADLQEDARRAGVPAGWLR